MPCALASTVRSLLRSFPLALALLAGCGHGDPGGLPPPPAFGLDVRNEALFVALGQTGAVALVDVGEWKVAGTLALSTSYKPHHVSVSPDQRRIGIAAPGADLSGGHAGHAGSGGAALYVLDSQKGDVVAQSLPGGTVHNLGFVSDSRVAYALLENERLVFAQIPDGGTELSVIGSVVVGAAPLEVTPSSIGLLVANSGSGSLSVVSGDPPAVTSTIPMGPTGKNPIAAWLGAPGRAYVTSESDRQLIAVSLADRKVERAVTLPGRPGQVVEVSVEGTPPTSEVWVALEDQGKILVLGAADLAPKHEIVLGKKPHGLAVSARGFTVFLSDEDDGRIYSIDVKTRAVLRSLFVGGAPNGIAFRAAL
jgi:DNA-binding beta-propeller fold protein YncE